MIKEQKEVDKECNKTYRLLLRHSYARWTLEDITQYSISIKTSPKYN